MALRLEQPGIVPLGQFDGYDDQLATILGGEVGAIVSILVSNPDLAAADADGSDGYVGMPPNQRRTIVTRNLVDSNFNRPLGLLDDGTSTGFSSTGYGTLLGVVVGGTAGRQSVGGVVLGPPTALGSGKITFWDKPGLYATTLDAVDPDPTMGLVPSNPTIATGAPLYPTATGLLTPDVTESIEGPGGVVVGRFIEFMTDGSLVNTPVNLVAPITGSGARPLEFSRAVYEFYPPRT